MGRKLSPEEIYDKAKANGYTYAAHHEEDSKEVGTTYVPKTIKDQQYVLNRYETWVTCVQRDPHNKKEALLNDKMVDASPSKPTSLRPGLPPLDLATMKDFFRFYALGSDGRLDDRITAESLNSQAERFFAGFTRITGSIVTVQDRSQIYNWVRKILLKDHHVVNKHKEKHLFGNQEMIEFSQTFWTIGEFHFIHPRNKAQVPFLMSVFCWTGARIGAFFPSEDNPDACLRYKDIQLVLLRIPSGGWKVIYNLSQRWVKNNRDPQNIVYKCSTSQHEKLLHDDTHYLLAMALADGALYGIESFEDLWDMSIPDGDDALHLRWKDEVLQLPVTRNATIAHGVTNAPLPRRSFERILKSILNSSGYFGTATVHAIRRALGKKLDERYTEVQRSQHINQTDPRIYGQSYVANTSSADGRRIFGDEEPQHDHVDYFQGFSQFREKGLPRELPAKEKAMIHEDPQLFDLQKRVQSLQIESASDLDIKHAINEVRNYRARVIRKRLAQFQLEWVRQRRDWKIDTRGKERPEDNTKNDLESALSRMMPERRRLARLMLSDRLTTEQERKQCIADLCSLISYDSTTFSLPGEKPVDGKCPVTGCETILTSLPKRQRSMHVHTCRRQEIAYKLERMPSELKYCYDCFDWFVEEEWDEHCRTHLQSLSSKRCASITYCSVLLRPSFCPFCMDDWRLRPSSQWQSWTKEAKLWKHLTAHIVACRWPLKCPHPICSLQFDDEVSFLYHLDDIHDLRMSPQMKKNWPNGLDSKYPSSWVLDAKCQKRGWLDDNEEDLLSAKRRTLEVQIGTTEGRAQGKSSTREDADTSQTISWIAPSEASVIDIDLDDDGTPELAHSNSTPSSEENDFRSIDDFPVDHSHPPTELPELFELSNKPSGTQASGYEAQLLEEEALFSQYLRSPSPVCSDTEVISHEVGSRFDSAPQRISPAEVCLIPKDHPPLNSACCTKSKEGSQSSVRPRVTLRINPPKRQTKCKLRLRLSQPEGNSGNVSASRNKDIRQRRQRKTKVKIR